MSKFKEWYRLEQKKEIGSHESMLEPITADRRRTTLSLMAVSFAWGFLMLGLVIGESAAKAESASEVLMAIIIGNTTLFIISFLIGYIGYKTGFNNAIIFRYVFGNKGMILPALLITIVGFGWQASFIGMFTEVWIGSEVTLKYIVIGLLAGGLMTYTTFKGIRGIEFISWPSIIIFTVVMFISIVYGFKSLGGFSGIDMAAKLAYENDPLSLSTRINMIIGSWIVGAMVASDFTRFCKNSPATFWFIATNFFFVQPVLQIMGAIGFLAFGTYNPGLYLATVGSFTWILIMLSLSLAVWTTGNTNLYFTQTPLANVFKVPRKFSALIIGTLATIVGALGMFNYIESFVGILASIVPPIFGPIVVDYYLINRRNYDANMIHKLHGINYQAIIAYILGVAVPLLYTPEILPAGIWAIIISTLSYIALAYISIVSGNNFGYLKQKTENRNLDSDKEQLEVAE